MQGCASILNAKTIDLEHSESVLDALTDALLLATPDGRIEWGNRTACTLLERELAGTHFADLQPANLPDFLLYLQRCSGVGTFMIGSLKVSAAGGERSYHVRGRSLGKDDAGQTRVLLVLGTPEERFSILTRKINELSQEVRKRRRIQAILEEALRERELLFRELHHRVRNNIQLLSSILTIGLREVTAPEAIAVLEDARGRVEAVGTAHQLFYKSDSLEDLRSDELVRAVTDSFVALGAHQQLRVTVTADSASLSNDRAIPVALVLNELLSNAAKHGVKGQPEPAIAVALKVEDGEFELVVHDNGPGFDAQTAGKRASGLGLIRGLVRQLGGVFEVEQAGGARCIVRFGGRGEDDVTESRH